jgi:hypothetical protein
VDKEEESILLGRIVEWLLLLLLLPLPSIVWLFHGRFENCNRLMGMQGDDELYVGSTKLEGGCKYSHTVVVLLWLLSGRNG